MGGKASIGVAAWRWVCWWRAAWLFASKCYILESNAAKKWDWHPYGFTLPRAIREETMLQGSETVNSFEPRTSKASSLKKWLRNWLSSDRRLSPRQPLPSLIAYYFTGGAPRAYQIADISSNGFYVLTEERWYPGTLVRMTLQRTDSSGRNLDDSIAVQSLIVREVSDGMGLEFVVSKADLSESLRENGSDKKTLERFLRKLKEPALAQ
jgi:hypothetical protein